LDLGATQPEVAGGGTASQPEEVLVGASPSAARGRWGRPLSNEERRERQRLSNRLSAKRSYYKRQSRELGTKQAIAQLRAELNNRREIRDSLRELLTGRGIDPDQVLREAELRELQERELELREALSASQLATVV